MELSEILYQKTNNDLKKLAKLCPYSVPSRKDDLVRLIHKYVMTPESLRQLWQSLDHLSQKAVAAAYHNDGEFNATAFMAQYGALPERPNKGGLWYHYEPILLDLLIYDDHLPADLIPLLAELVPPPEKFQVKGLSERPPIFHFDGHSLDVISAETEQVGLHDLMAYLRLVDQGQVKVNTTSSRATLGSVKKIMNSLLAGDFLPLSEKYRANETIRPFGLDVFAQEAGLVAKSRGRADLQLTKTGQEYYRAPKPEILLEAFETWTQEGRFDELSRISALKGLKSKGTRLTKPASRREAVIEALSWCPIDVWIDIQDFYRALKIWHFDFEVETTYFTNLYVGDKEYGMLYGDTYWALTKALYINVILWEYLGTLGAVDLLYTCPEETDFGVSLDYYYYDDDYFSRYDGLKYFRINNLGAYLLGQASEYIPAQPSERAIFNISADLSVTITQPNAMTPNDRHLLEQMAVPLENGHYRLDKQLMFAALEAGNRLDDLVDFLGGGHSGPLPEALLALLEKIRQNSQAFKVAGPALFIKVQSANLAEMVTTDSVLQKFCKLIDPKTIVIPANKEKAFRNRLKSLDYILLD